MDSMRFVAPVGLRNAPVRVGNAPGVCVKQQAGHDARTA